MTRSETPCADSLLAMSDGDLDIGRSGAVAGHAAVTFKGWLDRLRRTTVDIPVNGSAADVRAWTEAACASKAYNAAAQIAPTLDMPALDPDLAAALTLGIPEVDADHRRLAAHYQALMQIIEHDDGRALFGIAFHGLIASARQHFAHEEALMREIDFPGYELHKMAHKKLLRDAHDFLINILTVYARDERLAVARFIKYWILVHIDTHDRAFTNFVLDRARRGYL